MDRRGKQEDERSFLKYGYIHAFLSQQAQNTSLCLKEFNLTEMHVKSQSLTYRVVIIKIEVVAVEV